MRQIRRTSAMTVAYTGSTANKPSALRCEPRPQWLPHAKLGGAKPIPPPRPRKASVPVTSVGPAVFLTETGAGRIMCDPWVNPAYFASWFPFPDNSTLDWDALGDCDYVYVSHLHKDHFDAKLLAEH